MMVELKNCSVVGVDNVLDVHPSCVVSADSSFRVKGNGNKVIFEEGAILQNVSIILESSNNVIRIGKNVRFSGKIIMKIVDGNRFSIDDGSSCGGANVICGEGTSISIGADCMLAWGIELRSTDSHAMYDNSTMQRLNPAKDIFISDHVWVGAKVTILRGTLLSKNSVVGMGSLVKGEFNNENSLIAGVPAKVVRNGVTWDRKLLG